MMKENVMHKISSKKIAETIAGLCVEANFKLRPDVLKQLKLSFKTETQARAKKILKSIIENAETARKEKLAICQDTGLPVVFVELGQEVQVTGDLLGNAINKGVEAGYKNGYLRNSVVSDPISRSAPKYSPAVIHIEIVKGSKLKLTVLPKGFGCENKGQVKMFNPTANIEEIKEFILQVVKNAGPDACPPFVVGVGIGGTQDYACLLAKKALLRKIKKGAWHHPDNSLSIRCLAPFLERDLLKEINKLNIGPMGLGGKTTALGVNIETFPTHIAGLPVCVNISCHATRSATIELKS